MRNGDPSPIAKDVQRTDHGRLVHFQFGGDVQQRRPGVAVFGILQLPEQDGRPKSSAGQFVVARNEAKPAMPGEIESRLGVRSWSTLAIAPNAVRGRSRLLDCRGMRLGAARGSFRC
jgi:hypothetical protein